MLWRSALRADSTALLGPGSRRKTPFVRFAHCGQTVSASQFTKRAARADPGPALLVAPEIAPAGYRLPLNRHRDVPATNTAVYRQRRGRAAGGAPMRSREAQGSWPAREARFVD
jgi:hypothetical protein